MSHGSAQPGNKTTNKQFFNPIGSMYGIFTYIYHKNQPNVGVYTIHGSYGNRRASGLSRNITVCSFTSPEASGFKITCVFRSFLGVRMCRCVTRNTSIGGCQHCITINEKHTHPIKFLTILHCEVFTLK